MRKIKIIEHISLDGVIQAPAGQKKIAVAASRTVDGRLRMPTLKAEKPSWRLKATISICCWAAELTTSLAVFGRKPRRVRWQTV